MDLFNSRMGFVFLGPEVFAFCRRRPGLVCRAGVLLLCYGWLLRGPAKAEEVRKPFVLIHPEAIKSLSRSTSIRDILVLPPENPLLKPAPKMETVGWVPVRPQLDSQWHNPKDLFTRLAAANGADLFNRASQNISGANARAIKSTATQVSQIAAKGANIKINTDFVKTKVSVDPLKMTARAEANTKYGNTTITYTPQAVIYGATVGGEHLEFNGSTKVISWVYGLKF